MGGSFHHPYTARIGLPRPLVAVHEREPNSQLHEESIARGIHPLFCTLSWKVPQIAVVWWHM